MQIELPVFEDVKLPVEFPKHWARLASELIVRKTQKANSHIQPIVFLADNAISNEGYTNTNFAYTAAMAILASENNLINHGYPIVADISISRYFQELSGVLNLKVSNGTKNFLYEDALEPARLTNAINSGMACAKDVKAPLIQICAIGSGLDLAAEVLLKQLYCINANVSNIQGSNPSFELKIDSINIDNSHPFNYLARFGGYDTAAIIGTILQAAQDGKFIFIEGWSALAAYAICLKMFPDINRFVQIASNLNGDVAQSFYESNAIKTIFQNPPMHQRAFYLAPLQALVNEVLKELETPNAEK